MAKKTRLMREVEERFGKPLEEILEGICEKATTVDEIAAELGVDPNTTYIWMIRFGFERRWLRPEKEAEVL